MFNHFVFFLGFFFFLAEANELGSSSLLYTLFIILITVIKSGMNSQEGGCNPCILRDSMNSFYLNSPLWLCSFSIVEHLKSLRIHLGFTCRCPHRVRSLFGTRADHQIKVFFFWVIHPLTVANPCFTTSFCFVFSSQSASLDPQSS